MLKKGVLMMKLGEMIRRYREKHSMTTADFARLAGLSRPYVYMLEVNKNTNGGKPIVPSTATLMKVSKVINVPLTELIQMLDEDVPKHENIEKVSDTETSMLRQFRLLNPNNKILVSQLIDSLCIQQGV